MATICCQAKPIGAYVYMYSQSAWAGMLHYWSAEKARAGRRRVGVKSWIMWWMIYEEENLFRAVRKVEGEIKHKGCDRLVMLLLEPCQLVRGREGHNYPW